MPPHLLETAANHSLEWENSTHLIDYSAALAKMEERVSNIALGEEKELLWLLEHSPLYTAGTSAKQEDLLSSNQFPVHQAGRGGQYTYHGPGQRIVYVMLNLKARMQPAPDLRYFVWLLEEWIIRTLAHFEVKGERREGRVGIWVTTPEGREDKIAALGIRVRKWVSFHGLAINVAPELSHYQGIVPCGIAEHGVTSLEALGKKISMDELDSALKSEFLTLPW